MTLKVAWNTNNIHESAAMCVLSHNFKETIANVRNIYKSAVDCLSPLNVSVRNENAMSRKPTRSYPEAVIWMLNDFSDQPSSRRETRRNSTLCPATFREPFAIRKRFNSLNVRPISWTHIKQRIKQSWWRGYNAKPTQFLLKKPTSRIIRQRVRCKIITVYSKRFRLHSDR